MGELPIDAYCLLPQHNHTLQCVVAAYDDIEDQFKLFQYAVSKHANGTLSPGQ